MKCSLCQQDYDPRDCGMLEVDRCRDCLVKNLINNPCDGRHKHLCDTWNCKRCYMRSMASDEKCKHWDYEENPEWPVDVFRSSNKKYWFTCTDCNHSFEKSPGKIAGGEWCPYCATFNKQLCGWDTCKTCFAVSFASHKYAKFWSARNTETARQVTMQSNKKRWFTCDCGHDFNVSPGTIVTGGHWCPYCSHQKLCDKECKMCFDNSFASTPGAKMLIDKDPRMVTKSSGSFGMFRCKDGHEWRARFYSITAGYSCPHCTHKTEKKLGDWLTSNYTTALQPRFDWCRRKQKLPFDFQVDKWIIELDGRQHFEDVARFKSTTEEEQANDTFKMRKALENGYGVIRVVQTEVYGDTWDWQSALTTALVAPADGVQYLSKNASTYDAHKALMLK